MLLKGVGEKYREVGEHLVLPSCTGVQSLLTSYVTQDYPIGVIIITSIMLRTYKFKVRGLTKKIRRNKIKIRFPLFRHAQNRAWCIVDINNLSVS